MHTFQFGRDWVIHHNNESHPESLVTIQQFRPLPYPYENTTNRKVILEAEVPFGVLVEFVAQQLQRDALSHMENQTYTEWLRRQLGAPAR